MESSNTKFIHITRGDRCSICAKELTDPVSVSIGIGPECIKKIKIDKEAMAESLNKDGVYRLDYKEGDKEIELFHKGFLKQRAIDLDKEVGDFIKLGPHASTDDVLRVLENATVAINDPIEVSKTRAESFINKIREIRDRIGSKNTKKIRSLFDLNGLPDVESMSSIISLIDKEEVRFNSSLEYLKNLKDASGEKSIINDHLKTDSLQAWANGFRNNVRRRDISVANRDSWLEKFRSSLIEKGLSIPVSKVDFIIAKNKESSELDKALEKESLEDKKAEDLKKKSLDLEIKEKVYFKLSGLGRSGSPSEVESYLRNDSLDTAELREIIVKNEKELINRWSMDFEKLIQNKDWFKLKKDLSTLIEIDNRMLAKKCNPLKIAEQILSRPETITIFQNAVEAEGKEWGTDIRRAYGVLKGAGLWSIAIGKTKAS